VITIKGVVFVESARIKRAKELLASAGGWSEQHPTRCENSAALAALLLQESQDSLSSAEKKSQAQLSRMMKDPSGKVFTMRMTDECFRSNNPIRIADQFLFLLEKYGTPRFLSFHKKVLISVFKLLGKHFAALTIPFLKSAIQKETASVILPGEPKELLQHLDKRHAEGVKVNLNHLGEAVLGEQEALRRLQVYLEDLKNPKIECISVKVSTIFSQINLLAWEHTLSVLTERLSQLYRTARDHKFTNSNGIQIPKFVYLDMEEYRDLSLTVEAFLTVLDKPEFHHFSAGIVLQSYLPDSFSIQQKITEWAKKRVASGGAPIKIRIVKGANLAMEKVESSLKGWSQAPYDEKLDVDANFKRMVMYGCDPNNAVAAHLGIGSHNLLDISYVLLLRSENSVEPYVGFEMLEGMADHMRRTVQKVAGDILLYCPAATKEEFQNAVAYLIRRLDENTAPENFLRHMFGMLPATQEWQEQVNLFHKSCSRVPTVSSDSNRTQNRTLIAEGNPRSCAFKNEPDTDWTQESNRKWGLQILDEWSRKRIDPLPLVIKGKEVFSSKICLKQDPSNPSKKLYEYSLASWQELNSALEFADQTAKKWDQVSVRARSKLLLDVAQALREHRAELIGSMVADTAKTVYEADIEVSEAIDFAEYYARNIKEVCSLEDIQWKPKGTTLVVPPWNFPCSIPAGGILAALAAGNCVLFKPAPEAVLVGWELAKIFWSAGVDKEVLQFITCEEEPTGSQLIKDSRVKCIVLTGATATAKHFFNLRPGIDLIAETGGKNSIIVTSMSDRDLAIRDILQSAFGHAGQKCSACSLAILEAEVYDDPHFRKQLADAASSWKIGSPWDPATRLNPLIHAPNPTLLRGLTTLEPGETWLLQPKQSQENPNLWSPGIKFGVQEGSFTHQNELFGPVLGVMRADNLEHAIKLANGTRYGLTAGLHSLDEREHDYWLNHMEAGNCYINRGITGAIVQRQPFGGCKESSFGPGIKAGGPNFVMQLMQAEQKRMPQHTDGHSITSKIVQSLSRHFEGKDLEIWNASIDSYLFFWQYYFSQEHDPSHVLGQDNLLKYVSHNRMVLRIQDQDTLLDVLRVFAAANICGTALEISVGNNFPIIPNLTIVKESENAFIERIKNGSMERVRLLSTPSYELQKALAEAACNVCQKPVLANGRVELLNYLREVSISYDYHRYGNLGERETEPQNQSCHSCACQ